MVKDLKNMTKDEKIEMLIELLVQIGVISLKDTLHNG